MKSPYDMFETNTDLEKAGVKLNYGPFYIVIARAGGANKKFSRILEAKMKPYRRAIQTETIDEKVAERLLKEAFAEGVVLGWGSEAFGDGLMPNRERQPMDFTIENVVKLFEDLPELYKDVQQQANTVSLFRTQATEEDAGN